MLTREEADAMVAKGVEYMDANYPANWAEKTDLSRLNILSYEDCMMGQHGNRGGLSHTEKARCGFDRPIGQSQIEDYHTLTAAWRAAILARRAVASAKVVRRFAEWPDNPRAAGDEGSGGIDA
jgi:hypothetical protein